MNEHEKDFRKQNCSRVDEAYVKLENFETNELEVQQISGVYEKLRQISTFNSSFEDPMKESNQYFFWTRSTSEWSCSKEEFKKTFDALDEAAVEYESTLLRGCLVPLFVLACLELVYHTIWLVVLTLKRQRNGRSSNKYYPLMRVVFMAAELVCISLWICLLIDALS